MVVWGAAVCTAAAAALIQVPVAQAMRTDPRIITTPDPLTVSTAQPPAPVLASLPPADAPDADVLAKRLKALGNPGGTVLARVTDALTGEVVYQRGKGVGTPASSMKVLTSLVALDVLGPDRTFSTTAWLDSDDTVVLQGGGDPLLTSEASGTYPHPASLEDLARKTAAALEEKGVDHVDVAYDSRLFGKPWWNPEWPESFAWSVAPITALTVDHGQPDLESTTRTSNPPTLAAVRFKAALKAEGITVGEVRSQKVGESATALASVESPPVSVIVEQALLTSDNDAAETLAWQVALEQGDKPDPTSSAAVLTQELKRLGLWSSGMRVKDGNGISSADAVTAEALEEAIRLSLTDDRYRAIATGLPVAGVSGTLTDRFDEPATEDARGVVRAKTGTIRGVNTLTGYVVTRDGQTLAFSFLINGAGQDAARAWLDEAAAVLADCGC